MMTRRRMLAGIAAATLSGPTLVGCAGRGGVSHGGSVPLPSPALGGVAEGPRFKATSQPVSDPALFGLDAVIDMNHQTRVDDFAVTRWLGNILAVIHKASEGGDWVDPAYASRRVQARGAGMLWGAYHFGTRQYSGQDQAAAFLAAAKPSDDTLIVLDLEINELSPGNTMGLAEAEDFVQAIHAATGRFPLLYSQPAWADGETIGRQRMSLGGSISRSSILAACDLWLADYRAEPELPQAWANRGWRFWQYTGATAGGGGPFGAMAKTVAGIDRCDRNLFAGDADALERYWTREAGRSAV